MEQNNENNVTVASNENQPGKQSPNQRGGAYHPQKPHPTHHNSAQLEVGKRAFLADDTSNNIRLRPNLQGALIGSIQPGEEMDILQGPEMGDGMRWWFVYSDSGITGWTSEGSYHERWLSPVQPSVPAFPYPTRLKVGERAILDHPVQNRVRAMPNLQGAVWGYIQPHEQMEILQGPTVADEMIWWYVRTSSGLIGWTSEGVAGDYWLAPLTTAMPRMHNFTACLQPCSPNGSNAQRVFPEATAKIHLRWHYQDIPQGANYVRSWSMNGIEWARYDCRWGGPTRGIDEVTLTEPAGLHSGRWEMRIFIDHQLVLKEQLYVEGNHSYWDPAGVFHSCYGKK